METPLGSDAKFLELICDLLASVRPLPISTTFLSRDWATSTRFQTGNPLRIGGGEHRGQFRAACRGVGTEAKIARKRKEITQQTLPRESSHRFERPFNSSRMSANRSAINRVMPS